MLTTSASVGASLYPDHAADAEALLRAADVALFRAKELGRNRCALYSPSLYDAAAQRFRLEQSLRRAVEAGDLMLMYQPQISLHTFEPIGMEALLRWRKPDGRVATATEFIHIAEKTGLMHELTGGCCGGHRRRWPRGARRDGHARRSRSTCRRSSSSKSDFVEHVERALEVTGLPRERAGAGAHRVGVSDRHHHHRRAAAAARMGVSIALDDFGIGYSSLTSLEQLPITRVKLDRMLVEALIRIRARRRLCARSLRCVMAWACR